MWLATIIRSAAFQNSAAIRESSVHRLPTGTEIRPAIEADSPSKSALIRRQSVSSAGHKLDTKETL